MARYLRLVSLAVLVAVSSAIRQPHFHQRDPARRAPTLSMEELESTHPEAFAELQSLARRYVPRKTAVLSVYDLLGSIVARIDKQKKDVETKAAGRVAQEKEARETALKGLAERRDAAVAKAKATADETMAKINEEVESGTKTVEALEAEVTALKGNLAVYSW